VGEATAWRESQRTDTRRGEWIDPAKQRVTFGDYADAWLATKLPPNTKPKTYARYKSAMTVHAKQRFGAMPVAAVDHAAVRVFLAELSARGAARGSVANVRTVLSGVLGFAADAGAIKANPAHGARIRRASPHAAVFLTEDQVHDLADAIEHPPIRAGGGEHRRRTYPECALAVLLATYSGVRAGELWALRVRDIDPLRKRLHVRESLSDVSGALTFEPTKNYKTRTMPIPPAVLAPLLAHIAGLDADALVFTGRDGGPMRHGNWYRRHFAPAVIAANLPPGTNFHSLRHTCAAILASAGFSEAQVMAHLGHQAPVATYRHLFDDDGDAVRDALDASMRAAEIRAAERRRARAAEANIVFLARESRANVGTGEARASGG
jgi:integrase